MTLEIAYGNIDQAQADRLGQAAGDAPDGVPHEPGGAEPWVSRLVASFVIATGAQTVLETGCFKGATSVWLYDALLKLGGGRLVLCEIDKDRFHQTVNRMTDNPARDPSKVRLDVLREDVLTYLAGTEDTYDLAWVDDNHEKPHVFKELTLLYPKMNPGGIILGHDVWGTCDLQTVFKEFDGFSVGLPRLGAAGGIGIIQVPHPDTFWRYAIPWKQMP